MRLSRLLSHTLLLAIGILALLAAPSAQAQTAPPAWQPQIAIVWPQDGHGHETSVGQSRAVNVSVWPRNQVSCTSNPGISLWMAKNNEPVEPVAVRDQLLQRSIGGTRFPSLEFADAPADLADDPTASYTFLAGSVWVHAADARTYYPRPVVPTGIAPGFGSIVPGQIDSRIQIVWPHDAQGNYAPPSTATFVNIAVDLFRHGTLLSIDPQPDSPYFLEAAIGNGPPEQHSTLGEHTTYTVNGQTYPRWVFNNVPVVPGQQYHFLAPVTFGKITSPYTTIWTHAADARTVLPNPQAPPACIP